MSQPRRKAKLAHEKKQGSSRKQTLNRYSFQNVVELVKWNDQDMLIVEIDAQGTRALVAKHYASFDASTRNYVPGQSACPAIYDSVARKQAITEYEQYVAQA